MQGIASRVRRGQEGADAVLRFVVEAHDGTLASVEMRGHEIHGLLDDGDHVRLVAGSQPAAADGILRPLQVENLTTNSALTARRPSLLERAAGPLLTAALTSVVASIVTFCFGLLVGGGDAGPTSVTPGLDAGDGGSDWFPFQSAAAVAIILAVSASLWAVWFALSGRRRRAAGRRIWPVAPGMLLGVSAGLWAFAVSDGSTIG
jgi:hypothetical protein